MNKTSTEPDASPGRKRLFSRWWVRSLLILLLLSIALAASTPLAVSRYAQGWLLDHGAETADIKQIEFDPFNATLTLHGLEATAKPQRRLMISKAVIRLSMQSLFEHRLHIQQAVIDSAGLSIEHDEHGIRLGTLPVIPLTPPSQDTPGDWQVGIHDVEFRNSQIHYHHPGLDTELNIKTLELASLLAWQPDMPATLELEAALNGAPLELDVTLKPFAGTPDLQGHLQLQGIDLAPWNKLTGDDQPRLTGRFSIDSQLNIQLGEIPRLSQRGKIRLANARLQQQGLGQLEATTFVWDGSAALVFDKDQTRATVSGRFNSSDLVLNPTDRPVLRIAALSADGLRYAPDDGLTLPRLATKTLSLTGIDEQANTIATLAALTLQDTSLSSDSNLTIDLINGNELSIGPASIPTQDKDETALARAQGITLKKLQAETDKPVVIEQIEISQLLGHVTREADGTWLAPLHTLLAQTTGTRTATEDANSTDASNSGIRIDQLRIAEHSRILFTDHTTEPPVSLPFKPLQATIRDIDSGRPQAPMQIEIKSGMDKYASITINGTIKPFLTDTELDLNAELQHFNLPRLSPYTTQQLGYSLRAGQLDARSTLKIDKDAIDGNNDLKLHNIELATADDQKIKQLQEQLGMPLESALTMLRDNNNDIQLNVPISGKPDDPQFSLDDAINQAVGKAVRVAAVSYLKFTLQPFGTLITIGELIGKASSAVTLDPISYPAGSSELDNNAQAYLQKLLTVLQERPKLRIKLCGHATEADRIALTTPPPDSKPTKQGEQTKTTPIPVTDAQLLTLAQTRAEMIKDRLIKESNVAPERVFICEPQLDKQTDATARVEMSI